MAKVATTTKLRSGTNKVMWRLRRKLFFFFFFLLSAPVRPWHSFIRDSIRTSQALTIILLYADINSLVFADGKTRGVSINA